MLKNLIQTSILALRYPRLYYDWNKWSDKYETDDNVNNFIEKVIKEAKYCKVDWSGDGRRIYFLIENNLYEITFYGTMCQCVHCDTQAYNYYSKTDCNSWTTIWSRVKIPFPLYCKLHQWDEINFRRAIEEEDKEYSKKNVNKELLVN